MKKDFIIATIAIVLAVVTSIAAGVIYLGAVSLTSTGVNFANLNSFLPGGPTNGTMVYCKDCQVSTVCQGGGVGAFAFYGGGTWTCNNQGTVPAGTAKQFSVTAYGAKCDGATDDSTAFTAAMTAVNVAGGIVYIPAGTCVVNSTMNVTHQGVDITGAGWKATILTTSTANLPQIVVAGGIINWQIRDLWLDRSTTATSGGDGIDACLTTAPCNNPLIQNVQVDHAYNGLQLGPTAYGTIRKVITENNQQAGVLLQGKNFVSGNSVQWSIWDVLSQLNNGYGFLAQTVAGGGAGTLGPWHDAYTFANGTGGVGVFGTAGQVLSDLQIVGGFFGSDCADEIHIDSGGGGAIVIADNLIENAGQLNCGVGQGIAATNIGDGIKITSSTTDVMITGNRVQTSSFSAIETASPRITITGNVLFDNGLANVTGNKDGIVVTAAIVNANVVGNEMDMNAGYGIRQTGGTVNMTGNTCIGNTVGTHVGTIASNTGGAC